MLHFSFYLIWFFSSAKLGNKRVEQILPRHGREEEEVAQVMYTHVSKCKNNKIKILKNK
jgi:hypothetical protein